MNRRVHVIVEGQTEEAFVNQVLGPALWQHEVLLDAKLLGTSGHKGGNVSYLRVKRDILKFLQEDRTVYCTTLIDFYGRKREFPGETSSPALPAVQLVERIEQKILGDITREIPEFRPDLRLIPYIQLHEFEGLLFSDPAKLATAIRQTHLNKAFQQIRDQFENPECIDEGPETAPSKRILQFYPRYQKPVDGILAAQSIGLTAMRAQCPHSDEWVTRLESLEPL